MNRRKPPLGTFFRKYRYDFMLLPFAAALIACVSGILFAVATWSTP